MRLYLAIGKPWFAGRTMLEELVHCMKLYLVVADPRPGGGNTAINGVADAYSELAMKLYLATWPPEKRAESSLDFVASTVLEQQEKMKTYPGVQPPEKQSQTTLHAVADALAEQEQRMHIYLVTSGGMNLSNHSIQTLAESCTAMPLRVLTSYYYFKHTPLREVLEQFRGRVQFDLFLDSGAYSAQTRGTPIDIHEYARWIQQYGDMFSVYVNLDVIRDAEQTWKNQRMLEDEYGLSPLPVFHAGEDWYAFDRYLERYPYIGLGGGVGASASAYIPWVIQCFKRAKGRAVFHGFGMTTWPILKAFPWYSVDSSSWGQGFRFGGVPIFDTRRGRFYKMNLGDRKSCFAFAPLLRSLGFDPQDFADRSRNDRKKICAVSAYSYMLAEQWLQRRWGPVTIPQRSAEPGARFYLVETQPDLSDIGNVIPFLEQKERPDA